jgi:AraC-like DNA-binding protein
MSARERAFRRTNVTAQCATYEDTGQDVAMECADIGRMKIGKFTAGRPCSVKHPLDLNASAPRHISITLQVKGISTLEQHGRAMQLLPGTWGACEAPKPCLSSHPAGAEQIFFLIPSDEIRLGFDLRFVIGRSFSGTSSMSALMWQTIGSLFDQVPVLDPRRAEDLAEVAARLFHLVIYKEMEQPRSLSAHEETRDRISAYVENRLRDPRLSLDLIAADMNCTKRYLHMMFAGQTHTLNEYIWARRLERCRADVVNPALKDLSITEIAMSWGFSNLSHFSRAFRERFGMTPRAARAGAGAAEG